MKRKNKRSLFERNKCKNRRQELGKGFKCCNCKLQVSVHSYMGTANRNHCNMCLWSRHVDQNKGDRKATCVSKMKPIGLTFKIEGTNKRGEIMLVHKCAGCFKISINRIAADDIEPEIFKVFAQSLTMDTKLRKKVLKCGILLATESNTSEINKQLYGA